MRQEGGQLRPQAQRLLLQQLLQVQPVGLQLQVSANGPVPEMGQVGGERSEANPQLKTTSGVNYGYDTYRQAFCCAFGSFQDQVSIKQHKKMYLVLLFLIWCAFVCILCISRQ